MLTTLYVDVNEPIVLAIGQRSFRQCHRVCSTWVTDGKTGKNSRTTKNGRQASRDEGDGAVGLTGLEPVTLRLSSACSNQLSYRPFGESAGENEYGVGGGKGIRTPDIQLAKLALYQLSYAPAENARSIDHASRGVATEAKTELCVSSSESFIGPGSFRSRGLTRHNPH